jgi:hypothetical protein
VSLVLVVNVIRFVGSIYHFELSVGRVARLGLYRDQDSGKTLVYEACSWKVFSNSLRKMLCTYPYFCRKQFQDVTLRERGSAPLS